MNPRWFSRPAGVLLASLGDRWAAHSSLSGGSHLLNDESAAILLALSSDSPLPAPAVCSALASDWGESSDAIEALVSPMWDQLVSAGLVVEHARPSRG